MSSISQLVLKFLLAVVEGISLGVDVAGGRRRRDGLKELRRELRRTLRGRASTLRAAIRFGIKRLEEQLRKPPMQTE